jgi:hypothetical protein
MINQINQDNVHSMISLVTPGIIDLIVENKGKPWQEAAQILYNSTLYSALEAEDTKLWHLSPAALYDMLEEELDYGKITTIPEEQ